MANTHVLTQHGTLLKIVLHIAIPNTNNAVGTNWRTAVVNSLVFGNPPGSIMPTGNGAGQITSAELANIANGSLIEVVDEYSPNAAEVASGATYLAAMYTVRSAVWLNYYQAVLNFFGFVS